MRSLLSLFHLLLSKSKHAHDFNMMDKCGYIRPKDLDDKGMPMGLTHQLNAIGGLGMVLMWYLTQGSCTRNVALIFGQTCTPMYKWLKFARRVILQRYRIKGKYIFCRRRNIL